MINIERLIGQHFPDHSIKSVEDRGMFIKHTYKVRFENEEVVYVKVQEHPEWGSLKHEENMTNILLKNHLPVSKIYVIDSSCKVINFPFMIQSAKQGQKLICLTKKLPNDEIRSVYRAMGRFYTRLHMIHNDVSGLCCEDDPHKVKYPKPPAEYMYHVELVEGSGKSLLTKKVIEKTLYDRIISVWKENLGYLNEHTPTLINVSSFSWNQYLTKREAEWNMSHLTALSDFLWWDRYFELSLIKNPPFGECKPDWWEAFCETYDYVEDTKRMNLYTILQIICALNGVYMERNIQNKELWKKYALIRLNRLVENQF